MGVDPVTPASPVCFSQEGGGTKAYDVGIAGSGVGRKEMQCDGPDGCGESSAMGGGSGDSRSWGVEEELQQGLGWEGEVVAVLGLFDKGKTFVLNHLTESQLPSGKKVATKERRRVRR